MNLDLLNNIINNIKENTIVQNFIKELSNYLEKESNNMKNNKITNNNMTNNNTITNKMTKNNTTTDNMANNNTIKSNMTNNNTTTNNIKQENNLYQVVDMGSDGIYLQNVANNQIIKEKNMPQELLEKIGNDTVLRYKNGKYNIEEELTQQFFDSLIEIKEYEKIQNDFEKQSKIQENNPNTQYKIEKKEEKYSILSYEQNGKKTIKVPNELIPFWANQGEKIHYKNGEFRKN